MNIDPSECRTCGDLANQLAAANTRCAELEAEVERWSDRMWASVPERMTWQHVVGEHVGDVPYMHCPMCEATFHRAEKAALQATLDRVTAVVAGWEVTDDSPVRYGPIRAALTLEGTE